MSEQTNLAAETDELLSVRLVRILPASPDRVFASWTTADMLKQWWGPEGYRGLSAKSEPYPGGAFEVEIESPEGEVTVMSGIFTEVVRPSLVCMEIRHRQFEGASERPEGYIPTQVRVELRAHPDGTELTLLHTGFLDAALAGRFNGGWSSSFNKLDTFLHHHASN